MKKIRGILALTMVVVILLSGATTVSAEGYEKVYKMGQITVYFIGMSVGADGFRIYVDLNGYMPKTVSIDLEGDFTEDELENVPQVEYGLISVDFYDTAADNYEEWGRIVGGAACNYYSYVYYERGLMNAVCTFIQPGDRPVEGMHIPGGTFSARVNEDGKTVSKDTTLNYYIDGKQILGLVVDTRTSNIGGYKVYTQNFQTEEKAVLPTAKLTTSKVFIDGIQTDLDAYLIGGNNYIKLRDIAYVLQGTPAEFNTAWHQAERVIEIQRGATYEPTGAELQTLPGSPPRIVASSSQILCEYTVQYGRPPEDNPDLGSYTNVEVVEVERWPGVPEKRYIVTQQNYFLPTAYNVGGNNFYKLRDIAQIVGFTVDHNAETGNISITTDTPYNWAFS